MATIGISSRSLRLSFDSEWFAPSPNRRFGEHPKRGTLHRNGQKLKPALQTAICEAKDARRV